MRSNGAGSFSRMVTMNASPKRLNAPACAARNADAMEMKDRIWFIGFSLAIGRRRLQRIERPDRPVRTRRTRGPAVPAPHHFERRGWHLGLVRPIERHHHV